MLKSLKAATRTRHEAVERLLPLLDQDLTHAAYRRCVQRMFGFYDPFEAQLLALPWWSAVGLDYAPRRKSPQLKQDLRALGDSEQAVAALPRCERLPPLTNPAQLLGCLYVIEGATLGGQIIIKKLTAQLGLTASSGASFFNGYGAQTGARWKAFCAAVPSPDAQTSRHQEEMLESANVTFDRLGEWLFPDLFHPQPANPA